MKRRLLDRYLLAEIGNVGRSLQVHQGIEGNVDLEVDVNLVREHALIQKPPKSASHAFEMTLLLEAHATNAQEAEQRYFSGSVKLRAIFVTDSDVHADEQELDRSAHSIARYMYPVARMELFRLFGGARISEIPIPWDLGPDPTSEIG